MNRKLLLAATLLGSVSVTATVSARPMTPEDVAKLESVGAIAVSPNGDRVAYTTASLPDVTEGEKNGTTKQQLSIAYGPDNARLFLPKDVSPSGVSFSPDGSMVSFVWSNDDEDRAVWGIPVDGGAQRKLAGVKDSGVRSYAWAPDGGTIYMLTGAAEDKTREAQKKDGFNAVVYEEEDSLNRLFAASIGTEPDADPREITVPGYVSSIEILPGGTSAIIQTAPTPNVDDSYTSKRVNVIDLTNGTIKAVVATPGKIDDVEISPDGKTLSLIAGIDQHDPAPTTLHLVDIATGAFRAINADAAEATVDAEWMADGRLVTAIHKGANSFLRFLSADGSMLNEVPAGNLSLSGIDAGGSRLVVRASTANHPSELFEYADGSFSRWTSHNPWLSDIDFGKQSVITYTARDGQEIEGVLIEPVGGAPRGGAPLIMNVHGGPEAHESNGWQTAYSKPGQVAAGQGYAVFLPNYRGSTGYGVSFAKQHQGDYAGKEFDDIVDAKRHFVGTGLADADRVGITGGSYGGFASAWAATYYSAEYAASVMFVGISNNISKFGTTDIPKEMYLVHERKWPWEEWDELLTRSPIYHVDKAETPILIMHGDSDTRVSPTQSYELYRNIKVRKPETPVRLVLYPGEGHGNQRATSRYDYNLRMMEWFDTYLKTGDRDAAMPGPRPTLAMENNEAEEGAE
ncbi:S9 family peptidase [Pontixanthobacter gangjinensis]|uniref:Prolyl oligopeptidase family serine peptidase n=1 Tax=Pontixanthobacter gangjinensis TaxID=1028742 RepID=A0A6I4SKM9_9SPHN|nr:S9 family peptidase [Pontixanthobacter gangjinensis]MXO56214.1 prolyl oligopeptidase family serine peptidase [Pontixanthobacter gangjinensis]